MPKRQRKKQPSTAPGPTPQAARFQGAMALQCCCPSTFKAFQLLLPGRGLQVPTQHLNLSTKLLHEQDLQEMSCNITARQIH